MEAVKGSGAKGDHHDEDDAYGPCWELLEEVEEGDATVLVGVGGVESSGPGCDQTSGTNEGENDEGCDSRNGDTDPQIFISL